MNKLYLFRLNKPLDIKSRFLFGGLSSRHFSRGCHPWLFNFHPGVILSPVSELCNRHPSLVPWSRDHFLFPIQRWQSQVLQLAKILVIYIK